MSRFLIRFLPALAVVLVVLPLWAQQGRGRGFGPPSAMMLLSNKGVSDELKLSDEQQEKVKKAATEAREKHGEALKEAGKDKDFEKIQKIRTEMNTAFAKTVEGTLKPEQVKRLHQIEVWATVQFSGPAVFSQERVEKEIKLSDKQKDQLKEFGEEATKIRAELKDAGKDKDKRQEVQKKMQTKNQEAMAKFVSGLSDEQKKVWKDLAGEKFEVKFERRPKE